LYQLLGGRRGGRRQAPISCVYKARDLKVRGEVEGKLKRFKSTIAWLVKKKRTMERKGSDRAAMVNRAGH